MLEGDGLESKLGQRPLLAMDDDHQIIEEIEVGKRMAKRRWVQSYESNPNFLLINRCRRKAVILPGLK
jgi:hypothetical protein